MSEEMDDIVYLPIILSPVTITPPRKAPSGYRVMFPNYDPSVHVLNVDRVPDWFSAGDLIEYRKGRVYARSLTQTEPRWQRWLRQLKTWF